ncbi:FecR family protein [Chitinophaga rupis]|uniref:FecR family protein n=1 Tax=Chitinophaga rupis TaxID=573321 RepID=A0A1H7GV40_9BACT|nr:FecR domain-containing protein [Chitinophaga rupis]SEK41941.1 FecR family protein [Chitinophaga rupis]
MKPDEVLLAKFYKGTCTPQEARQVMDWLLENENAAVWAQDWETAPEQGVYPDTYTAEMLQEVYAQTFAKQPRIRKMPWRSIAAAASVLLLTGLFLWQQVKHTGAPASTALATAAPVKPVWKVYQAPTGKTLQLQLADGSSVVLEPGALLQYDSLTYNINREVMLKGKGLFNVAASEAKPFSVNTGSFITTALGTSFRVASLSGNNLQVRLYNGKVKVRQTGSHVNDVYLKPGEELVYDPHSGKMLVSDLNKFNKIPALAGPPRNGVQEYEDCIVFDNTPLKEVLTLLEQQYHVPITYEQRAVTRIYFSGKVMRADSLELILNTIVRINNLALQSKNGGYLIK